MINRNVRDLELDIPAQAAETLIKDNLTQSGWTIENENWMKRNGETLGYYLKDMQISFSGQTMQVQATFAMPVPWAMGDITEVWIPMQIRESVLYVEP